MRKKRTLVLAVALALVAAVAGVWFFFGSRTIKVWVYTDYAFRINHQNWPGLVESRFQEVNRIYSRNGTGVVWKVLDSSQTDPTSEVPTLDGRRATMALHQDRPTDVYVILTGVQQGERTGSVSPFSRFAIIVDYPNKSEAVNSRLLAHELAHLFGVPHDPAWIESLMAEKPESNAFSPRAVAEIWRLRRYPFAEGIDGLSHGSWEKTALEAASQDDIAVKSNALAHAHSMLGIALIDERKMAPALLHFRAAVAADPKDKTLRLNLAEAYTRDGQYEPAVKEAREAVRLAPDDAVAHRALGALFGRTGQPEASLQELQTAIRLEPQNSQNKILLGLEYAGMFGRLDDAVSTLQEAAEANPNSDVARKSLEKAQHLKENVERAIEKERGVLHDHPDDPDAHYRLAKAEARAGDLKGAIQDYRKSADLRPSSGSPHVDLAELYLVQGDADAAWAEIRKARALGVEPPQSLLTRMPQPK